MRDRRDVDEIKARLQGRERECLIHFGFRAEDLDGKHRPCPMCKGRDRFRYDKEGWVICNQCFKNDNHDIIAAVRWRNGWDFPQTIRELQEWLHLGANGNGRGDFTAGNSPRGDGKSRGKKFGRIVKRYPYLDEEKKLLRWHVRTADPKGFFWQAPNGRYSVEGIRETLYRLPELKGCTEIWIVEGEKDTDTLWEHFQIPATTNGAKDQWHQPHTDQFLASGCRQAVIIPDQDDDGGGQKHAKNVAAILTAKEVEVRILTLNAHDLTDWKEAGGEKEDLLERAAKAPVWKTPEKPRPFKIYTLEDLRKLPPVRWIVQDMIPTHGISCLYGKPNVGKSFFALEIGLSVAAGEPLRGLLVERKRVLYCAGEGEKSMHQRIEAFYANRKEDTRAVASEYFRVLDGCPRIVGKNLQVEFFIEILKETQAEFVIIDTLACATGGSSEDIADMGEALAVIKAIQHEHPSHFLLLHHPGKDESRGARGGSNLLGDVEAMLHLVSGGDEGMVILEGEKVRDASRNSFKKIHLMLTVVPITGVDQFGRPLSSCAFRNATTENKENCLPTKAIRAYGVITDVPLKPAEIQAASGLSATDWDNALRELKRYGLVRRNGNGYIRNP